MDGTVVIMWLVIMIELALCVTILVTLLRVLRGVNINVNINTPAPAAVPDKAPDIEAVQVQLDKLEQERRKGEQQLVDLVGTINQLMTGGDPNAN